MRSPVGLILAAVLLTVATAVCSFVGFTTAREFSLRAAQAGIRVSAPNLSVAAQPTMTPFPTRAVVTAPPNPTALNPNPTSIAPEPTAIEPNPTSVGLGAAAWSDPRRVTILVMGVDQRQGEVGPFNTDTLILVSVDPVRRTAGVLSIPRDLWVTIPGFQSNRINTANRQGEAAGYPGGGAALAVETIELNFGIPVNYYIMVNFEVFTQVVTTLAPSGLEVCPQGPIQDDSYPDGSYGIISVRFDAGCQRLDAERLLQYARTRHGNSDFDRARRQQEVLDSFREEILNVGGLLSIAPRLPQLWADVSSNIQTNLTYDEILSLAQLAQDIPRSNIQFGVLDNLYVDLATTSAGDQVLIPRQSGINFLLQQIFNPQGDLDLSELRARAEAENADIVVFNNTPTQGLAGQTRDWLVSRGVSVANVGNVAQPTNGVTLIRDYTGRIWTARYLAALLGLPPDRVQPGADGATTADVMVVVGSDIGDVLAGSP
jgi:polyisoprenyl-teichoic acid--peptidoglycan teichoic acid transferase